MWTTCKYLLVTKPRFHTYLYLSVEGKVFQQCCSVLIFKSSDFLIQCMLDRFYSFCIQAKYTNNWCVLTMHDGWYQWKKQNKISNQKSWGYTQEPKLTTPTNTSWCDYCWQSKTKSKTICALIFNTTLCLFIASKSHFIWLRKTIEWLSFFQFLRDILENQSHNEKKMEDDSWGTPWHKCAVYLFVVYFNISRFRGQGESY